MRGLAPVLILAAACGPVARDSDMDGGAARELRNEGTAAAPSASEDAGKAEASSATRLEAATDTRDAIDAAPSGELTVVPMGYTPPEEPVLILRDGGPIELWAAPQGGHVLGVGARVRGLEGDTIEIRARIRNPQTRAIVAEEARTVVTEPVGDEPQWRQTDRRSRSQVAHVPACPDYDERSIVGEPYVLEVEVAELYRDGFPSGSASLVVVPTCNASDPAGLAHCRCECSGGYVLGKCGARPRTDGGDG